MNSPQRNIISDLYECLLTDSITCKECGYQSNKEMKIYNFNLTVKDTMNNLTNSSIEQGLAHYLKEEHMEKDNQYNCPDCDWKTDALKGFKIVKLPKILLIQLNRFTYDFTSANFQRIKLNDRVTFPPFLNMSKFMSSMSSQDIEGMELDNPLAKVVISEK